MNCLVLADAGPDLGYGHVRRTLAVCAELRRHGVTTRYLMGPLSDDGMPRRQGYEVIRVDGGIHGIRSAQRPDAGPVIIDLRGVRECDLRLLRRHGYMTIVFDDLCLLDHYIADIVINAAPGSEAAGYRGEETTTFLLGTRWVALGPEFAVGRDAASSVKEPPRLLVAFGGSDPEDQTLRALKVVASLDGWRVDVILGPGYRGDAERLASGLRGVDVHRDPPNIASIMSGATLAVSGAGSMAWELAAMGVPAVLLELAPDQGAIATSMQQAGVAVNLGPGEEIDGETLRLQIAALAGDPDLRREMGRRGRAHVDGGGAGRIASAILDRWHRGSNMDPPGVVGSINRV